VRKKRRPAVAGTWVSAPWPRPRTGGHWPGSRRCGRSPIPDACARRRAWRSRTRPVTACT
jgi:hypothetical protein